MSLVDERYGGPLDGAGERESTPCDALGGEECWALNCSHMCTAVCIVGPRPLLLLAPGAPRASCMESQLGAVVKILDAF